MNVKSSYWLGVHIVPFCDLNKLPPIYCLPTTTSSTSGRTVDLIVFSPILATHISYKSDDGAKNTRAYSFLGSRYIGDGNRIVVAKDASSDTLIWFGFNDICAKSWTNRLVGVPSSIVLNSTNNLAFGSFLAKYTSNDVKKAPVSSTVNDCARGSLLGASINCVSVDELTFTLTVVSLGLWGGGGGFLTATMLVVWVIITPVPVNTPDASLALDVSPGKTIVPSGAAVILNVFVPDLNVTGGFGSALAFLKKNAPIISPQLSENKSTLVTLATAPLDSPIIVAPFTTYPKYSSLFANAVTSIFNNLDVAE